MWNPQIPNKEVENVLSVYWQMLRLIEVRCENNPLDKSLVSGAYKVLNRCGVTDLKPTYR